MKAWLKNLAALARKLAVLAARPALRPLDRHLAGVVRAALAEPFGQLTATTDELSRGFEAAQATYLHDVQEIGLLGDATVRELVRCQRRMEVIEQALDELRRHQGGTEFGAARQRSGEADPPPAEAA